MHNNSNFRWRQPSVSLHLLLSFESCSLLFFYLFFANTWAAPLVFHLLLQVLLRILFQFQFLAFTSAAVAKYMPTDCGLLLHFPFDCLPQQFSRFSQLCSLCFSSPTNKNPTQCNMFGMMQCPIDMSFFWASINPGVTVHRAPHSSGFVAPITRGGTWILRTYSRSLFMSV